jgi:hypothetical protein
MWELLNKRSGQTNQKQIAAVDQASICCSQNQLIRAGTALA